MTALLDRADVQTRRHRLPARRPWAAIAWRAYLIGITALSLGAHLFRLDRSYDLFIDEPFYTAVGRSVAHGQLPYAAGVHFFLHPPGFFYIEALWMRIVGVHDEVFAAVYSVRNVVAVYSALSALMIALIVERVAGRLPAIVASMIFAANAFVIRDSSIVILEPATMFWALTGFATLLRLPERRGRSRTARLVGAGLLFGISVLTKEFAVFITLVPMFFVALLSRWLSRREALAVSGLSLVPYSIWVVVAAASGNWSTFWTQFMSGFSRTAGTKQITGFNRAGAPSFLTTLINNISYLWTAYLILGVGSLAILYLAWRPVSRRQLFISCFGLGALPLILYCIFIGTNEEQFFNFLFAPALIAVVVLIAGRWRQLGRVARTLIAVALATIFISDVANYAIVRTTSDNGTYLVDKWMADHVPPGTHVGVTNSVQREIFTRYTMIDDDGPDTDGDVRYLIVFYKQVDEGYAFVSRTTVEAQTRGLPVMFSTSDRSNGRMVIYRMN